MSYTNLFYDKSFCWNWLSSIQPITVAERSKAWTVFARSDAGIEGSNPIQGMDICVCVRYVFVLFCV
jgi:hypothetical protein